MAKKSKDMEIVKTLAERLQNLRQEKGLTLKEIAFDTDMELTQVHRIFHGSHDPQLTTIDKVAKALGSNLSELLKGL